MRVLTSLDELNSESPVGLCSSYTIFHAAVVKPQDLSQDKLLEPLEAKPERYIHSSTISDPSRYLVQDVPWAWPVGSQHKIVFDQSGEDTSLLETLASGDRVAVMVKGLVRLFPQRV